MNAWALAAAIGLGLQGCHRSTADAVAPRDPVALAALEGGSPAPAPTVLPARCRAAGPPLAIDDDGHPEDVEIGDALAYPGGLAVALARRTAAGRMAAVARLDSDAEGRVTVVDLGPTPGDAPPPRLAWRGVGEAGQLVAASYVLRAVDAQAPAARILALQTLPIDTAGTVEVAQQRDDSFAFDVAFAGSAGLTVWDDAAGARGVIRAAPLLPRAAPRDVSPADTDAELPRVVPNGGGFLVFWVARRPDPNVAPADASDPEAVGEERSYGWLEVVAVDARGATAGAPRRLTSPTGHLSAYDVEVLPAAPKPAVLVVARDNGESVDGSGGTLLRVKVTADSADPPTAFPADGLGRGAPTFVEGGASWLSWVGREEVQALLPLDGAGVPSAAPSVEDAWSDGRPLLALSRGRLLIGAAGGASESAAGKGAPPTLRAFACSR
ncbi:MAG TPA: hypothetical protein VKU41_09015 [Polyangiaceae bacterium]|nr:hypothetical protein [Polyangiaceae bacterium]